MQEHITSNTLFYGDNLKILREDIASNSVDLVYVDPDSQPDPTSKVVVKCGAELTANMPKQSL